MNKMSQDNTSENQGENETAIELAMRETEQKKIIAENPKSYYYPNLSLVQKERLDKVQ